MRIGRVGLAMVGFALASVSLAAHHSFAMFEMDKDVEYRGVVKEWKWQNPHVFYYLDVSDDSGKVTNWSVEASTPNQLYRNGWRKDDLKTGEVVTVANSSPARNGLPKAYGGTLTLADGRKVFSGSAATDQ
jgi:hypothetical protein